MVAACNCQADQAEEIAFLEAVASMLIECAFYSFEQLL